MKKTKSVNNLMINTCNSERGGKFKNIMNSPNFGKQQIILQSCCFFDYDKCQTPSTQSSNINFSNPNKNRINSNKIKEKSRNIFSKNKYNMELIKTKFDEMKKNEVDNLKNENKVLKDTINNLISQLDKTFRIAENVKHKEKNISQINIYNENEIINMKNKINSLLLEKQQLLNQIKKQESNFNKNKRNSWISYQSPKFGIKRNISFTNFGYNKYKNNNNIFLTETYNNNDTKMYNKSDENNIKFKKQINSTKNINENYKNDNSQIKVFYDKRLNKRKYIFNKKKTENLNRENQLMKSKNIIKKSDTNYNSLRVKYEKLLKEKNELKTSFNGLLNECDNSRIKYSTEEESFINDISLNKSAINLTQINNDYNNYSKNKISNLEKINYQLRKKLDNIEMNEKIKYDLLMNKYNKLYSDFTILKTKYNNEIKIKEEEIQEVNNKYNNLMKEYNNKNSAYNNLKAKYDQILRINNNNINLINNNRIKLNEVTMENNEIKNELRKKIDEITQKNIEIGRFKKIINDINELKNLEKKLKQTQTQNNENKKEININSLNNEIEEYKLKINKLNKENEELQKELDNIKNKNNKNNNIEEYKIKLKKLEEDNYKEINLNKTLIDKNKKLESALTKANQELDQYEIESKEADIEIKSFKMKINELLEEIKKLKHKETIEEVNEENYEEDEDKKETN